MLALVATMAASFFLGGRGRKAVPAVADLDAVLADVDSVSVGESLRRIAIDEVADGRHAGGGES
jgi:hypothetical protein